FIKIEQANDPFKKFKTFFESSFSKKEWDSIAKKVQKDVKSALNEAENRDEPEIDGLKQHVFCELTVDGYPDFSIQGGLQMNESDFPHNSEHAEPEAQRTNMVSAIRRTLDYELKTNPKLLVFGEDVGPKGGVHTATLGLQEKYGIDRVFDTSLSEEGIIGRAVGMALNGLMPVPEIQFRKYADPATEQINDCGTIRWRTANRFAAPIVVRIPGGFFKCGDPWHSMCNEVQWVHSIGWQVLFPSNAEDAVGLLRSAMRSNNPSIFFEHRSLYDGLWARRPYPGDQFIVPIGKSKLIQNGEQLSVITWGAMVERCEAAAKELSASIEIIDLRSIMPWDKEAVIESVNKTGRVLIVHEDTMTAGFGAEIAAVIAKECFYNLDAPVDRLTMPDVPSPYNVNLLNSVVPSVDVIRERMQYLIEE
ncbi:MAG: pyruvate dehydrogenase, partial [Calditrichaeota bacterium]|nr:pyruvate dehydrogenase [Calditrichota bacterium]